MERSSNSSYLNGRGLKLAALTADGGARVDWVAALADVMGQTLAPAQVHCQSRQRHDILVVVHHDAPQLLG